MRIPQQQIAALCIINTLCISFFYDGITVTSEKIISEVNNQMVCSEINFGNYLPEYFNNTELKIIFSLLNFHFINRLFL